MLMVHVALTPASACGVAAVNDLRLNVSLRLFTVASQHADIADFPLEIVLDLPVDDLPVDDPPVDVLPNILSTLGRLVLETICKCML